MNRKNNPWVSLVALLLAALILVLTCTGCKAAEKGTPHRFTYEAAGPSPAMHESIYIITDTETGVQYLLCGGGLTKLEG